MTGVICDGFADGEDVVKVCPGCKKETVFRVSAYYDLAKCRDCGKVYAMILGDCLT